MLQACLEDAKNNNFFGVAVVVRRGAWMAGRDLFVKHGFEPVDTARPDFELLEKKVQVNAPDPKFTGGFERRQKEYGNGLYLIASDQCPYVQKAITDISSAAKEEFGIEPSVIMLENARDAQQSPCPFGTFALIYNGTLLADHPVSRTRFRNIMKAMRA